MKAILIIESLLLLGAFWWWLCSRAQQDPNMIAYLRDMVALLTQVRDLWKEIVNLQNDVLSVDLTNLTAQAKAIDDKLVATADSLPAPQ